MTAYLQELVELHLGQAVAIPAAAVAYNARKHFLQGCKQAASAAARKQILCIPCMACDGLGKLESDVSVCRGTCWSTHLAEMSSLLTILFMNLLETFGACGGTYRLRSLVSP